MRLQTIVEGHSEVAAMPVLLRRLVPGADVLRPIRIPRGRLVKEHELARAVQLAMLRLTPGDAILVTLDADDDCAAELGPRLHQQARSVCRELPISIVAAVRELEAWFVAAAASLSAAGMLRPGTTAADEPEALPDAKGWLSARMDRPYRPTLDQPRFSARFHFTEARGATSFARFEREVMRLAAGRS